MSLKSAKRQKWILIVLIMGAPLFYGVRSATIRTTSYTRSLLYPNADANDVRGDLSLHVFNVKDDPYLAKGDGVTDDTAAIRAAIAASEAAGTSGVVGAGGTSGGRPTVYLPVGDYLITDYLTEDIVSGENYLSIAGTDARIICDTNDITVFGGLAFDCDISGLIFHNGNKHISIKTNNINTSIITISNCEFHDPNTAAIISDNNSGSTLVDIHDCKFRARYGDNGGYIGYFETGFIMFRQCWWQSHHPIAVYHAAPLWAKDIVGAPQDDMVLSGGAWFNSYSSLFLDKFRAGAESGGAYTIVKCNMTMDTSSPVNPTILDVRNSYIHPDTSMVEFYTLPNVVSIVDNHGFSASGSDKYIFATSLDVDDALEWQLYGHWNVEGNFRTSLKNVDAASDPNTALLVSTIEATDEKVLERHAVVDRVLLADIYGSAEWADEWTQQIPGGFTASGDTYADDGYGVQERIETANEDLDGRILIDTDFLDESILTPGDTYTLNMKVTADVNQPAYLSVAISGQWKREFWVENRQIINIPFVYLNYTGSADTLLDRCSITMKMFEDGDVFKFGRVLLLKGITPYNGDVLNIATTTRPTANTAGLKLDDGFFKGDIAWRQDTDPNGVFLEACVTAGAPGTWNELTLD